MKIIYLHQYFKTPNENGGTRSYDLARRFVEEGIEVEFITTTSNNAGFEGEKWKKVVIDGIGVNYLYLPYDNSFSFLKRIVVFLKFIWSSTFKLLSIKGDLVLATSTPLTIGIPALVKKSFHGIPFVFEVRDVWPEAVIALGAIKNSYVKKVLYSLEYLVYKKAMKIVPLSTDMRKSIVSRFPEFKEKTNYVIENISETDRFGVKPVGEDFVSKLIGFTPKTSVLYAGTFGKVNNIEYLIRLACEVYKRDDSVIFLLLGSGSERATLIEMAQDLKLLNKNVFFIDPVGKSELPNIYSSIDVGTSFVANIPELWANSANKFFDTLASGKPILINHYGWQSELIIKEKLGVVLSPEVNESEVETFLEFVSSDDKLKSAGRNARVYAEKNFSLEIAVKKYLSVFNEHGFLR